MKTATKGKHKSNFWTDEQEVSEDMNDKNYFRPIDCHMVFQQNDFVY